MNKNIELFCVGCLLIFCGAYILSSPQTALLASALSMGIVLILLGLGYLLTFKKNNLYSSMALGILDILMGLLFIFHISITSQTMPMILALWVLFNAISQIIMSFELKSEKEKLSKPLLYAGISGIFVACIMFIYPIVSTITLTLILGGYLIYCGVIELQRYFKNL